MFVVESRRSSAVSPPTQPISNRHSKSTAKSVSPYLSPITPRKQSLQASSPSTPGIARKCSGHLLHPAAPAEKMHKACSSSSDTDEPSNKASTSTETPPKLWPDPATPPPFRHIPAGRTTRAATVGNLPCGVEGWSDSLSKLAMEKAASMELEMLNRGAGVDIQINGEQGCCISSSPCSSTSSCFVEGSVEGSEQEQHTPPPRDCVSPAVCRKLLSLSEDMNLLVRNITKEAKALVQAEICSLFLLDKEHSELVAEVFEKNGTSDEYLTEIRMPLTQGIVGHVATTGQMMNVKEVYNHPYFYPKVDERTGFVTRNILCFPIKDSQGNLVGVAELCNKIGKSYFTKHDEQIATTFAVYCAISISHCLLYRKLQEAHRRSHMAAELLVQGSTLSIAPEDILRLTVREIPPPTSFHAEFNGFHFVPRSIGSGDTYVEASLSMFKELGFIDKYRVRRRTLARFLLMVQKGYRDVPYHNWSHAFAVGHFCYLLIRMPSVMNALNDLERFSLLVACLCHDIDHRGTTNAFQVESKTPLAQLYSSEGSVLERHHFAQTVTILGMDECNIFEQLTRQQYQTVLDSIREIILATDIAAHLAKVPRIKQMVNDGYDAESPDHHYLLMCLLMTASDLSDQSKDFKNSKGIAENIYKEFFSQGDLESKWAMTLS
uniref:Phosphodiesterase n=1 Tax=Ditylenchus dipsaci TaxID=166011 RepID=A0A915D6U3_9BILA